MGRVRQRLAMFLVSWSLLFLFALLLFGALDSLSLMASGAVGLAAAASLAASAAFARPRYAFRARWLRQAASVPHRTVVDFAILTRELVRRRPREGVFREKPFDAGRPGGPVSSGWRAFVGIAAGYSPNAYVIELDPEHGRVLVHDLVPSERSEAPA